MLTNNGELFSLNQNIMTDEYNKRKKKNTKFKYNNYWIFYVLGFLFVAEFILF